MAESLRDEEEMKRMKAFAKRSVMTWFDELYQNADRPSDPSFALALSRRTDAFFANLEPGNLNLNSEIVAIASEIAQNMADVEDLAFGPARYARWVQDEFEQCWERRSPNVYRETGYDAISVKTSCALCGQASAGRQCASCRKIRYCGRDCQRAHWPVHKPFCSFTSPSSSSSKIS